MDRVIGYNNLDLVAILAAAIIHSQTNKIVKCRNFSDVDDLFSNLIEVNIIDTI